MFHTFKHMRFIFGVAFVSLGLNNIAHGQSLVNENGQVNINFGSGQTQIPTEDFSAARPAQPSPPDIGAPDLPLQPINYNSLGSQVPIEAPPAPAAYYN